MATYIIYLLQPVSPEYTDGHSTELHDSAKKKKTLWALPSKCTLYDGD